MNEAQEPQTWRHYLGVLLGPPGEKQRVARELGVSPLTLTRWVEGTSEPRLRSLKDLPGLFHGHEQRLKDLIQEAYGPVSVCKAISPEFSARVLALLARTAGPIVTSAICQLVLRQAIEHLDPDSLGMEITVAQCTPVVSADLPVRSLFEWMGAGTPPWPKGVGRRLQLLGAESLCGYVVGTGEPALIQNTQEEQGLLPVRSSAYEQSAAVYPLLRRGRIAGSFLVSSTQREFFTEERIDLVEQYANLVALAYYDEQFYRLKEIRLDSMPASSLQQPYRASFRQRVLEQRRTSHLGETEAELRVVQEIETALLQEVNDPRREGIKR